MRVDEQALLNQVKRGNVQAFSALVNMYRERVLRLAFHLVGSYEDAEDVAQETFVRAYFSMNKYDPTRPFAPWIYRIATNLCMDNLRRRKARPQQVELPPHMELFNSEEEKESPEELILRDETHSQVLDAIQELPENYRAVLVLRYFEDLPYSEIAQILGTSEANVQMRLSRARQRLRERLKNIARECSP